MHYLQGGDGSTVLRDAAAVAGANRHLRIAGTTHAVPHSVRTSANMYPGATQRPPAVGGTTAPAIRGTGPSAATAELPAWTAPRANFRPEVPAAAPPRIAARATELPEAEPEPAERHAAVPATAGAAELRVGGQGATTRRPTAMTRRMAQTIMAAEPQLSRTELANRLGVSTRRLREVLAA